MFTLTFEIDEARAHDRDRAHALVDAIFDAGAKVAPTNASTEGQVAGREKLSGASLRVLLQQLADGEIGRPLNDGERAMLLAIAQHAPEPFDYGENRALLGTGAQFGNVSSGLARRFRSRGYELPYTEGTTGYVMSSEDAAVVQEVLAPVVG